MSRVFVIPDIHLKPWILDRAEEELSKGQYDVCVFVGDLVDDWDQGNNMSLYKETIDRMVRFIQMHPKFKYCYGNHDVSYVWQALETGYSERARETVLDGLERLLETLPRENVGFIHRIDNVLFSHAGLTKLFVERFFESSAGDIDELIAKINSFGRAEMWCDTSPIWARPQLGNIKMYPDNMLQVVGHTPVKHADYYEGVLTVDNFSTFQNGAPIGDQRFVWVDSITREWGFSDKGDAPVGLPDPMRDIRYYSRGDRVDFRLHEGEKTLKGCVEVLDRRFTSPDTIDIRTDEGLYKHVPLECVVEHFKV